MPAQIQKMRRLLLHRLHSIETVFQIGNDVVNVFGADGKADGVLMDARRIKLLVGELRVGGGGGMDDERFYIRDVGEQREDFQTVDEAEGFFLAALDIKREDRTAAVGEVFLIQRVVGMIGK